MIGSAHSCRLCPLLQCCVEEVQPSREERYLTRTYIRYLHFVPYLDFDTAKATCAPCSDEDTFFFVRLLNERFEIVFQLVGGVIGKIVGEKKFAPEGHTRVEHLTVI